MALKPTLYTLHGIARELRQDRPKIADIIAGANIQARKKKGSKYEYYYMAEIVQAWMGSDGLDLTQERAQLAREQTRRLERENDIEERKVIGFEEVVELLQVVSKQAAVIFDGLPLNIKRRAPQLKAKDIEYIKLEIAKARNLFAETKIDQ